MNFSKFELVLDAGRLFELMYHLHAAILILRSWKKNEEGRMYAATVGWRFPDSVFADQSLYPRTDAEGILWVAVEDALRRNVAMFPKASTTR